MQYGHTDTAGQNSLLRNIEQFLLRVHGRSALVRFITNYRRTKMARRARRLILWSAAK